MDMRLAQIRFGIGQTIIPEDGKMLLETILAKAELNKENMVRYIATENINVFQTCRIPIVKRRAYF